MTTTDFKGTSNVIKEKVVAAPPHPLTIWARPPLENLSPPMVSVGFCRLGTMVDADQVPWISGIDSERDSRLLVSTYVVCERLSVMHEPAGVVENLVQILQNTPIL